jgi:uncharacterized protein with PIN domain
MLDSVRFETVLILTQDRCMVCAKRTTSSEIMLDAPDRTTRWNIVLVHLETVLVLVQDRCTVCAKHTVGSEIVLDAPDSTPR